MTSSAPPSNPTMRSKTLGCGALSSCRRSLRTVKTPRGPDSRSPRDLNGPPEGGHYRLLRAEGVLRGLRAGNHVGDRRLLAERARDRFLRRLIVVVVDLLVVGRVPVDE